MVRMARSGLIPGANEPREPPSATFQGLLGTLKGRGSENPATG
jgi:hypothetical protein